jgi:hypothetical protein
LDVYRRILPNPGPTTHCPCTCTRVLVIYYNIAYPQLFNFINNNLTIVPLDFRVTLGGTMLKVQRKIVEFLQIVKKIKNTTGNESLQNLYITLPLFSLLAVVIASEQIDEIVFCRKIINFTKDMFKSEYKIYSTAVKPRSITLLRKVLPMTLNINSYSTKVKIDPTEFNSDYIIKDLLFGFPYDPIYPNRWDYLLTMWNDVEQCLNQVAPFITLPLYDFSTIVTRIGYKRNNQINKELIKNLNKKIHMNKSIILENGLYHELSWFFEYLTTIITKTIAESKKTSLAKFYDVHLSMLPDTMKIVITPKST